MVPGRGSSSPAWGLSFGLLELVDYDSGATQYSVADARNIRLITLDLPGLLLAGAISLLLKHPITKRVQQQLREQINLRSSTQSRIETTGPLTLNA